MKTALKDFLVADLFCGAGGSSTGAEKAIIEIGGRMVLVCVNHWPVAIETHKRNHPAAQHYVEDITVADPYKIVPGGYLDLLMASPECRFYSRARGGKPVHDQGRMNPWAVHRWLTSIDVRSVLVENVCEFVNWGPLLPDGRPDPNGRGLFFQAWFKTFWEMGYQAEWRYLNAADYGDATTRTRFFLIARKDGRPIKWPAATHSETGDAGMLASMDKWRAAREIIDWDKPGLSIFDSERYKKKPLSPKTLQRIARGIQKFGGPLASYYTAALGYDGIPDAGGVATPEPFVIGKQSSPAYRGMDEPIPTVTCDGHSALVNPTASPFILGKQSTLVARAIDKPIPTVTCRTGPQLIQPEATPFVLGQQSCAAARTVENPIPTVATDGAISLINPVIVKYHGHGTEHSVEKPLGTLTTKDRFGLANGAARPFIVPNFGERGGQQPRVHDIEKPAPAVTSHGAGNLVCPLLIEVNHEGGDRARSVDVPLGSLTTKRGTGVVEPSVGLAEPVLQHMTRTGDIDPRRIILLNGEPYILDIKFRMLNNTELARAMGFTTEEQTYEFAGNSSEVTKQIGNAVAVGTAKALVKAILKE